MNSTLHIHLLGDFLLVAGETPVSAAISPRAQSLLAYLVLHRAAPQDRSHLAFLLWPDSTEAQAHTNLRKALFQLRQVLPDINSFLEPGKHSIQWLTPADASWTLDVLTFEQALAEVEQAAQAKDMQALRRALEQAIRLYQGDLLPGCYDEWILAERDRLRQLFLAAATHLIPLLEEERDYAAAIGIAQQLLRQDALHEATYRQLMRLYALSGERAAALRVYHTCVTVLERELGAEPGKATQALYESLLQAETPSETKTGPLTARGTAPPLLGRKAEWRQFQEVWRKVAHDTSQLLLLSGEAGIGKTRLAEEMVAWVHRQGMATASARCYTALGQLTYAPLAAWLRANAFQKGLSVLDPIWLTEVARLVPDLLIKHPDLPRPAPMTEGWQRQHFFEALAHAVAQTHQPLLLLLDDLQWCDTETFEWLHYLFRFQPAIHLLLIGTVRTDELYADHPLKLLLSALQRDNLVIDIPLGPLTETETATLAEHIVGRQLDATMPDHLYRETEGNPLFVVEMVRAGMLEENREMQLLSSQHSPPPVQSAVPLPSSVQSILSTRLAQLSPLAHELASLAAVIGREFTFAVLARASGEREDAVVQGLDELWQRRIVREQGMEATETYDFSHDKLRAQAYASLSPAHRRLLHRRIAEAYEEIYVQDRETVSGQIAVHYERAGLPEQSIRYYQRAAETALSIYANAEAITAFRHAVTLLEASHGGKGEQWELATSIYKSLGDILVIAGRVQEAREAYQGGMAHVPAQEYIWQARLLRRMAGTWHHASHNPLDTSHATARSLFQDAGRILEQAENKASSEWVQEWIDLQLDQLFPLRGSAEEMTAIIEKAQSVVEEHGTAIQRGQFFQAMIARDSKRNRYGASEQSLTYRRSSLASLQQTGNKNLIGFAYFVLGNGLLFSNQLAEAEEQMRIALDLARQIGNTPLLLRCLAFLPVILRRRDKLAELREVITQALAVPEASRMVMIQGHRAWLAWRDGNMTEAEIYGRAAINQEQAAQGDNAFRWTGLWPLIGVMLTQEKTSEAISYVRLLLDPTQQPQPEQLASLLTAALQAEENGQQTEAQNLLRQAAELAGPLGYL